MKRTAFGNEIVNTTRQVQSAKAVDKQAAYIALRRREEEEIKKKLPIELRRVKKLIRAAALRGDATMDQFPSGLMGERLVEKLGEQFYTSLQCGGTSGSFTRLHWNIR